MFTSTSLLAIVSAYTGIEEHQLIQRPEIENLAIKAQRRDQICDEKVNIGGIEFWLMCRKRGPSQRAAHLNVSAAPGAHLSAFFPEKLGHPLTPHSISNLYRLALQPSVDA